MQRAVHLPFFWKAYLSIEGTLTGHSRLGTFGCNGSCAVKGCLIDKDAFQRPVRVHSEPNVHYVCLLFMSAEKI